MKRILFIIAILSALSQSCEDTATGTEGSDVGNLTITVISSVDQSAVVGAEIVLTPTGNQQGAGAQTQTTGTDGTALFNELVIGQYSAAISRNEFQNASRTVTVTTGTNAETISLDPLAGDLALTQPANGNLSFSASENEQSFTVANNGGASATMSTSPSVDWLSIDPPDDTAIPAGGQQTFRVFVNRADPDLAVVNDYTASIALQDVSNSESVNTLNVTVTVAKPSFSVNISTIRFEASETSKDFIITNGNQTTIFPNLDNINDLIWATAEFRGDYNSQQGLSPSDNVTVRVTADRNQLAETLDNLEVSLPATAEGPDPDPLALRFTVVVERPIVTLSTDELAFNLNPDSTSKVVVLSNTGNAELNWSSNISIVEGAGWLSLSPSSGSISDGDQTSVEFEIDRTAFTERDTYNATVSIADADPLVDSQEISVSVVHEPQLVRLTRSDDNTISAGSGLEFTVFLELRGMLYHVGEFDLGFSSDLLELVSVDGLDGAISGYSTTVVPAMDDETRAAVVSANANGSFRITSSLVKNSSGLADNAQFPTDGTGRNLVRLTFIPKTQTGTTNINLNGARIYLVEDLNNAVPGIARIQQLPIIISN